jgi:type IV fimbrial biogenesis protein FimT
MELMIAIAVMGVLLGVAVPTFRQFSLNNSVTAAQNDLVTSFSVARSEALRRNRPVSVCASTDGAACGDETMWKTGWMAFTDRGTAGTVDGSDEVLQIWRSPNSSLVFNAGTSTFVQYLPTGMSAAALTMDVSYAGCTGLQKRHVVVLATGSVAGTRVACP